MEEFLLKEGQVGYLKRKNGLWIVFRWRNGGMMVVSKHSHEEGAKEATLKLLTHINL